MKYITFLFLSLFLVSCGQAAQNEITNSEEKTNSEIETELSNISHGVSITEKKIATAENEPANIASSSNEIKPSLQNIEKLSTKYNNPAGEVTINIEYKLDSAGTIESISTTSDYDGNAELTNNVQVLVGKTIEEAINADIAGGSLTNAAFKNALKTQLSK